MELRHRIISGASPGIAAKNTFYAHPSSFKETIFLKGC
jgi:hypothetical protein